MSFCNSFRNGLKSLFNKIDSLLLNNIDKALSITTNLKNVLNSETAIIITSLTPTSWDDNLRALAVKYLETAIVEIGLIKDLTQPNKTPQQVLIDVVKIIETLSPSAKEAVLSKLGSLLTRYFDEGRFDKHFYDSAFQMIYSLKKIQ